MNKRKGTLSARENVLRRIREKYIPKSLPGKASDYLHHLDEYLKKHPDLKVVIYCRVSACMQRYKGNLDMYEMILRRALKKRGVSIVGCYREVSSGWILNEYRGALVKAVQKAKRRKNRVIVTTSTDRFLRNRDFTTNEPDILPTEAEYEKLRELTCNVPLLTLLHPDTPPRKVRSRQSTWGQRVKGNKGGRPKKNLPGYKKRRRLKKLAPVLRLRKKGASWGDISAVTGISKTTAADWVKKYG